MKASDKLLLSVGLAYMVSEIFSGPLRYYLSVRGLAPWIYTAKGLMILAILIIIQKNILKQKISVASLAVISILLVFAAAGTIFIQNKRQVLFGLWTYLPFAYGIFLSPAFSGNWQRMRPFIFVMWLFATAGVIVGAVYKYPWVGYSYAIGNQVIEGSREWYTMGVFRTPGFSRASFEAAAQILLLGFYTVYTTRLNQRILIWLLTGLAIVLTTSKTPLGIWILLSTIFLLGRIVPLRFFRPFPIAISALSAAAPISAVYLKATQATTPDINFSLFSSLIDRFVRVWPSTIQMVGDYGSMWLGRGVGGVGSPQRYFEGTMYSPADNLAVYLFATAGIIGLAFLAAFGAAASLASLRMRRGRFYFMLSIIILLEGMTVNIFESPIFALSIGITVRYLGSEVVMKMLESLRRGEARAKL